MRRRKPSPPPDPFAGPSPLGIKRRHDADAHRRAVIDGVVAGKSSAEIADEAGISTGTVKNIRCEPRVRREIEKAFAEVRGDALATMKARATEVAEVVVNGALTGDIGQEQLAAAKYVLTQVGVGESGGDEVKVMVSVEDIVKRAYGIEVAVTKKAIEE